MLAHPVSFWGNSLFGAPSYLASRALPAPLIRRGRGSQRQFVYLVLGHPSLRRHPLYGVALVHPLREICRKMFLGSKTDELVPLFAALDDEDYLPPLFALEGKQGALGDALGFRVDAFRTEAGNGLRGLSVAPRTEQLPAVAALAVAAEL